MLSSAVFVSADELSWETALKKVIVNSPVSDFLLMDVSGDGIPELFCPGGNGVASYYFRFSPQIRYRACKAGNDSLKSRCALAAGPAR